MSEKKESKFDAAHLDHGITSAHMAFLLEQAANEPLGFVLKVYELPGRLLPLPDALYGPRQNDDTVKDEDVTFFVRGSARTCASRCIDARWRPVRSAVVIGINHPKGFQLFTAYGGRFVADREPGDISMLRESVENETTDLIAASLEFWSTHALADTGRFMSLAEIEAELRAGSGARLASVLPSFWFMQQQNENQVHHGADGDTVLEHARAVRDRVHNATRLDKRFNSRFQKYGTGDWDLALTLAAWWHDSGKPETAHTDPDSDWSFHKHPEQSIGCFRHDMVWMQLKDSAVFDQWRPAMRIAEVIIAQHERPRQLALQEYSYRAWRRLDEACGGLLEIVALFSSCDTHNLKQGDAILNAYNQYAIEKTQRAEQARQEAERPRVDGALLQRLLKENGKSVKGPKFGALLQRATELLETSENVIAAAEAAIAEL